MNAHVRNLARDLENNQVNRISVQFGLFQTDDQVARVTRALHGNDSVDSFDLYFTRDEHAPAPAPAPALTWGPLVRELESREKLKSVEIIYTPSEHLLPLFRELFPALQQNTNLQQIQLQFVNFSRNISAEVFISFLDQAPSLTDLTLCGCSVDNSDTGRRVAEALRRNDHLQTLELDLDAE